MRRTVLPLDILRRIRDCRLSREGLVRLFAGLHGELTQRYERYSGLRHPDDDRLFFFFDAFTDQRKMHTFTFHVDDCTSPEHLIIADLEHDVRRI